jgi:hypothetical protein
MISVLRAFCCLRNSLSGSWRLRGSCWSAAFCVAGAGAAFCVAGAVAAGVAPAGAAVCPCEVTNGTNSTRAAAMRKWGDRFILDIDCNSFVDFMLPGGNLQAPTTFISSQKSAANLLKLKVEVSTASRERDQARCLARASVFPASAIMRKSLFSAPVSRTCWNFTAMDCVETA